MLRAEALTDQDVARDDQAAQRDRAEIGHMKTDGRLGRNPLKGALGDALHAVMCGAGHNIRLLLKKLRLHCAEILAEPRACLVATSDHAISKRPLAA